MGERRVSYAGLATRELFVDGDGPKIVLLHGFGSPADVWLPALTRFVDLGHSAVAMDLPGFGASGQPGQRASSGATGRVRR